MATVLSPLFRGLGGLMAAAVLCLTVWALPAAHAGMVGVDGPIGSQGFTDFGAAAANTDDINDATAFSIGTMVSTDDSHGYFAGLPNQFFGTVTFSIADPLSLQFGTLEFGRFASTSIRQLSNDPLVGSRSFFVEGTFTKGTFGGALVPNPAIANFTISFNQTAGAGTSISDNATLDFPIQPVPEPATLVLAVAGLTTVALLRRHRR
ncbi:MAG: PEP-CTERM sorting domain-containing protein [Planctomycetia bacterium]